MANPQEPQCSEGEVPWFLPSNRVKWLMMLGIFHRFVTGLAWANTYFYQQVSSRDEHQSTAVYHWSNYDPGGCFPPNKVPIILNWFSKKNAPTTGPNFSLLWFSFKCYVLHSYCSVYDCLRILLLSPIRCQNFSSPIDFEFLGMSTSKSINTW